MDQSEPLRCGSYWKPRMRLSARNCILVRNLAAGSLFEPKARLMDASQTWAQWCLLEPLCVGLGVGSAGGLVGLFRRLLVAADWPRSKRTPSRVVLYSVGGAWITCLVCVGLTVIGCEWIEGSVRSIAAVVALGSVAVDYSSDSFAGWLRSMGTMIARAYLAKFPELPPSQQSKQEVLSSPDDRSG